jgi:hypothetical protein|tara:strand:+ start:1036 stop:1296 length:261 start_codon:yes stop_codon:yes gene_type:complete
MGNTNEIVASYVSEEELNRIRKLELKNKLKKQIKQLDDLDTQFYRIDWIKSRYKNGGYGVDLGEYNKNLTHIFLVRTIYFWYSNSK